MNPNFFFLDTNVTGTSADYVPIGIQVIFAAGFVVTMMVATHLLGPKRHTAEKLENFTSGIESHGNARQPLAIKYFLVAILFVLFDVEVIFFYPYAVNFKGLGWIDVRRLLSLRVYLHPEEGSVDVGRVKRM